MRPEANRLNASLRLAWALALTLLLLLLALLGPPTLAPALPVLAVLGLFLCVLLCWQLGREATAAAASRAQTERLQAVLAALPVGVLVFDDEDRIEHVSGSFSEVYGSLADLARPGVTFETLLRAGVARGLVPEAVGQEEAWISARLAQHRRGEASMLRELPGGRWRRIVEQRMASGGLLSYSVDVSDLVLQEHALAAAHRDAELARQRLQDAIEALPVGFELYDAEDRLLCINEAMAAMYPLIADLRHQRPTFEEVVRTHAARGGLPWLPDAAALEQWLQKRKAERKQPHAPLLVQVKPGQWVQVHERPTREGGLVGVRIDVSEREAQRREVELARAQLHDAVEALPDGFAIYDSDDRLLLCNQRYRDIYAASAPAMVPGASFESIIRAGLAVGQYPQALGREEDWLAERLHAHRHPAGALLQELPGNRWLSIDERRTRSGGTAGVRADVTELVRRGQQLERLNLQLDRVNRELAQLSDTDALTGTANRRHFDRHLAEAWIRVQQNAASLALLIVDIDHFKTYNDLHGHPAGDVCLRQVAQLLKSCARQPDDLVARLGGEEFAVLMPNAQAEQALALARRFLQRLDNLGIPHGQSPVAPHITCSVGVAASPGLADTAALMAAADAALYLAKRTGRHRVCCHGRPEAEVGAVPLLPPPPPA